MARSFHDKPFDVETQLKLEIFRRYLREWIPTFLTRSPKTAFCRCVNVFDFFAGPGSDAKGNPGSPRIIQDEIRRYCDERTDQKAEDVRVHLHFNDADEAHIRTLRKLVQENACPRSCCETEFSTKPFQECLADCLPRLRDPAGASLVIMDQFGWKEVTPEVVATLAKCGGTDILFFVSSSFIGRFAKDSAVQDYHEIDIAGLESRPYNSIHRAICDYFRAHLPEEMEYYLAPFSIKKQRNIHGVIFGSGHLKGLKKFLTVCWGLDGITGEANFDIDDDPFRTKGPYLFPEMNIPKKLEVFHNELEEFLAQSPLTRPITNQNIFRFTLERGFLPKHAHELLRRVESTGRLSVTALDENQTRRKNAFYLDNEDRTVVFRLKD